MLDPETIREVLEYRGGRLFWKHRGREWFSTDRACSAFNSRYAGREAFTATMSTGYKSGAIFGKGYLAHRVIWAIVHGEWPDLIDHLNGDRTDNRVENLRSTDKVGNGRNVARGTKNVSGIAGVSWSDRFNAWRSRIHVEGNDLHLGYFKCIAKAVEARRDACAAFDFSPRHGLAS